MRNSINHLFEQIIPFVGEEDITHLLEVIQRPNQEYIEDINDE